MATTPTEKKDTFKHVCDKCGKIRWSAREGTPVDWATIRVTRPQKSLYGTVDGSFKRLWCTTCTGRMMPYIGEIVPPRSSTTGKEN